MPRVIQEIQCGSGWKVIEGLVSSYCIDVATVGPSLLLHAATAGNDEVVTELIDNYNVSEATCDKDGRNMLHIVLLHKHFPLVEIIRKDFEDLFLKADNKGLNAIHYIIMSKNVALLECLLYDNFLENTSSFDIANLVDLHFQRFDDATTERVTNVITPVEWAKRMKQPEMVKVLEQYVNELRVIYKMSITTTLFTYEAGRSEGALTARDQLILTELMEVSQLIDELGLQRSSLIKMPSLLTQLSCLATYCCNEVCFESVKYLIENFFSLLHDHNPDGKFAQRMGFMLRDTIMGPYSQAFPNSMDKNRIEDNPGRWAREVGSLFEDWSPDTSLLAFTQETVTKCKERTKW